MVRVHADLRRQIKCHGKTCGALGKKIFVALVRFFRVAHAGVLAHGPKAAAIHGGLHAAGKRKVTRITHVPVIAPALKVSRRIQRVWIDRFDLTGFSGEFEVFRHHELHESLTMLNVKGFEGGASDKVLLYILPGCFLPEL